ncbi:autotransporter domain-containing protein [Ancylobacter lacus]|uniref:autotransporter domain-containing protein n=1 Tax=Ancylobacter lacus TaxID=2579970 RepID=UPI001BCCD6DF|nr:autotransporter domain-containing protein [Ancylobacter lacus]MBS7538283.1 autotransporter domain-containing protein [Ancylobacter lacus]
MASTALFAGVAGLAGGMLSPARAADAGCYAQPTPAGEPTSYVCSGTTTLPQVIWESGAIAASTTAGFSVTTENADALFIAAGGASYIDMEQSSLTATRSGGDGSANALRIDSEGHVLVESNGSFSADDTALVLRNTADTGGVSAFLYGPVSSSSAAGIDVVNHGASGINLNVASVSGGTSGITLENHAGLAGITASDAITGGGDGIYVWSDGAGVALELQAVTGDANGIRIVNAAGPTVIEAEGTVTGGEGIGIWVQQGIVVENGGTDRIAAPGSLKAESSSEVSITAGDVSGTVAGIQVVNHLDSDTSITSTGSVTATVSLDPEEDPVSYGIDVSQLGHGDVTLTAGTVTGDTAIRVVNSGGGDIAIIATDVTAGAVGIQAENSAGGAISITAGDVTAGTSGAAHDGISATLGTGNTLGDDGSTAAALTIDVTSVTATGTGIAVTNATDGPSTVTVEGAVRATGGDGIRLTSSSGDIDIAAGDVDGSLSGITAGNWGDGDTIITVTNTVRGGNGQAITVSGVDGDISVGAGRAEGAITVWRYGVGDVAITADEVTNSAGYGIGVNAGGWGDVVLDLGNVTGATDGIVIDNAGGATAVIATGTVTGTTGDGISIAQEVEDGGDAGRRATRDDPESGVVVDVAAVNGQANGIVVENGGDGPVAISAGSITAGTGAGLSVETLDGGVVIDVGTVSAGEDGIDVIADGGPVTINAAGAVSGGSGTGVYILVNGLGSEGHGDIDLSLASVSAYSTGIYVYSDGPGTVSVAASGPVVSTASDGIGIVSYGGDIAVSAGDVRGNSGIAIGSYGTGNVDLSVSGTVTAASGPGVFIVSSVGAVSASLRSVTATLDAVSVSAGGGIAIASTGTLTSQTGSGVVAQHQPPGGEAATDSLPAGNIAVDVTNVAAANIGVLTSNGGTGTTAITTRGLVAGGLQAISATSTGGAAVTITNTGTLGTASGAFDAIAIETVDSTTSLVNAGALVGAISFGDYADTVTNSGTWQTGGTSTFGAGSDSLVNAAGASLVVASAADRAETTVFAGLEQFTNAGTLSLHDGGAGDTVEFTGNATFQSGSVVVIDLGPASSDRVLVDGTATLQSGVTLAVNVAASTHAGESFTVLTAAGGLTGTFGTLAPISSFLGLQASYDAQNAYVEVVQARDFVDAAVTPNQIAVAQALDSLPVTNTLYDAVAALQTDAEAQQAFDLLSGGIYASTPSLLMMDAHFVRDTMFGRMHDVFTPELGSSGISVAPLGYAEPAPKAAGPFAVKAPAAPVTAEQPRSAVWTQAFGSWGSINGDGNAYGIDRSGGGFFIGADTAVTDNIRAGVLGGYTTTSFSVDSLDSSGDSDTVHAGGFVAGQWGGLGLRGGGAYAWSDVSTSRSVAFSGFADQLSADYDASTAQLFGEIGYRFEKGPAALEPFAGLFYVRVHTDGFTEQGGEAALTAQSSTTDTSFSTLGLRGAYSWQAGAGLFTARGLLGWQHAFGDTTPESTLAFSSGSDFVIAGVPIAENVALIGVGLDYAASERMTFGLAYDGQFGDGSDDQGVTARFALRF